MGFAFWGRRVIYLRLGCGWRVYSTWYPPDILEKSKVKGPRLVFFFSKVSLLARVVWLLLWGEMGGRMGGGGRSGEGGCR